MKTILKTALAAAILIAIAGPAAAQVHVNPYTTRDGTYVPGHMRSAPDSNPYNNYSTQGNTNPWTGERGYTSPYQRPSPFSAD